MKVSLSKDETRILIDITEHTYNMLDVQDKLEYGVLLESILYKLRGF